jgi:hypothetical protein
MENMIEIAPNQLPLFADLLTVEQEQRVTAAKADATKHMNRQRDEVFRKVNLVDAAGFTSEHYDYNVNCIKMMQEINVNSWKEERKMVEVEMDHFNGNFYIMFDEYDKGKNEIIKRKAQIELHGDKIECYWLNNNSRTMKPSTILTKITEAAEKAKYKYKIANQTKSTVEYTVDKYKKLYPDAEVTAGKGYTSGRGSYTEFDTVTVKFKSGSYVVFEVYTIPDNEYVRDKVDVVFRKMSINEVMDYFNAQ